jgi:hypothetical protein
VGRDPECDVILPDSSVSRRHLKITAAANGLFVEDMGSSNGTWLDGRRVNREVIPPGHPFIVGRVSMALRFVDGAGSTPYKAPAEGAASRHETLAVDVPQNFFEPGKDSPAMRVFDCPACKRRLRCQVQTKRVKCRNCGAIIRFVNEVPQVEQAPLPGNAAKAPTPSGSQEGWVDDARQGKNAPLRPIQPEPTPEEPEPETFWTALMALPFGAVAASAVAVGAVGAVVGAAMAAFDKPGGVAMLVVSTAIALAAFIYAANAWSKRSSQAGAQPVLESPVEQRLQRLAKLYRQGLISEEEYRARKSELLRDI